MKVCIKKIFGNKLSPYKLKLIDVAFEKSEINSFADLGGVWGVDGGYSFYILSKYNITKAYMVDVYFSKRVVKQARRYPQIEFIKADLRLPETFQRIDKVDLALLFDVLLHQVNWQEVLSYCAEKADILAIYNPQFLGEQSVRLLVLGEEEYFKLVPHNKSCSYYRDLFTPNADRDNPSIWQWGICDSDLIRTLEKLDFQLIYSIEGDYWANRAFRSKGFIFQKAFFVAGSHSHIKSAS